MREGTNVGITKIGIYQKFSLNQTWVGLFSVLFLTATYNIYKYCHLYFSFNRNTTGSVLRNIYPLPFTADQIPYLFVLFDINCSSLTLYTLSSLGFSTALILSCFAKTLEGPSFYSLFLVLNYWPFFGYKFPLVCVLLILSIKYDLLSLTNMSFAFKHCSNTWFLKPW